MVESQFPFGCPCLNSKSPCDAPIVNRSQSSLPSSYQLPGQSRAQQVTKRPSLPPCPVHLAGAAPPNVAEGGYCLRLAITAYCKHAIVIKIGGNSTSRAL